MSDPYVIHEARNKPPVRREDDERELSAFDRLVMPRSEPDDERNSDMEVIT